MRFLLGSEVTAEKKRPQRKDAAKEDNLGWGPLDNLSDAVHEEAAIRRHTKR